MTFQNFLHSLASIKWTIFLLTIITVICIIGAFLEYEYALRNIFSSLWFWIILSLFTLNLLACSICSFQKKTWFNSSFLIHLSILLILLGGMIGRGWGIKGSMMIYEKESSSFFFDDFQMKKIFKQFDRNSDGRWDIQEIVFWQNEAPERKSWDILQYDADHNNAISFTEWFQAIPHAPAIIQKQIGRLLPFRLFLEEFITEHYPPSPCLLVIVKNSKIQEHFHVVSGSLYQIPWTSYQIKIQAYSHTIAIPATITLTVFRGRDQQTMELSLSGNPEGTFFNNLYIRYYVEETGQVKAWKSVVKIFEEEKMIRQETIAVNHPLHYRNFSFFQSSYYFDTQSKKMQTGLTVVKDPGIPFVYLGFFLLSLALIFRFCVRPWIKAISISKRKQDNET